MDRYDLFEEFFDFSHAIPYDDVGDAFEFRYEIPGVKKENVYVSLKDNQFSIRTERKIKDQTEERKGKFTAPPYADLERAEALVADGILTIRLPKTQVPGPRMIPIK